MDRAKRLALLAELDGTKCELNHGPGVKPPHAVDYLVQPFGYKKTDVEEVAVRQLVIPICDDCAEGLAGDEWVLIVCYGCCESQWIFKQLAHRKYTEKIKWVGECPKCRRWK